MSFCIPFFCLSLICSLPLYKFYVLSATCNNIDKHVIDFITETFYIQLMCSAYVFIVHFIVAKIALILHTFSFISVAIHIYVLLYKTLCMKG